MIREETFPKQVMGGAAHFGQFRAATREARQQIEASPDEGFGRAA